MYTAEPFLAREAVAARGRAFTPSTRRGHQHLPFIRAALTAFTRMTEFPTFTFRLILSGPCDDEVADRLMDRCGDMTLALEAGRVSAEFDREAACLEDAILTAIRDVESASAGVRVDRVDPDDLVTATVVAQRSGRTRQSIAQLIAGDRGPGGFPAPLTFVDAKTRIWRWSEVADWLERAGLRSQDGWSARERHFVAAINGALEARTNLQAYIAEGGGTPVPAVMDLFGANPDVEAPDTKSEATLRAGIGLQDLAAALLGPGDELAVCDEAVRADAPEVYWMHSALHGHSATLRLYMRGQLTEPSPYEDLVVDAMSAFLAGPQGTAASKPLPILWHDEGPRLTQNDSARARRRGLHQTYVSHCWSAESDFRRLLVDRLQTPDHIVNRIAVWIDACEPRDRLDPRSGSTHDAGGGLHSRNFATRKVDPLPDIYGLCLRAPSHAAQAPAWSGWSGITPPQRLWAISWSFGQTLRLFVERADPAKARTVSTLLDELERLA